MHISFLGVGQVSRNKGLFINDVTQYWALLDLPPCHPM